MTHVGLTLIELERPQSRHTDQFSNIVADREFLTSCYLLQFPIQACFSILSVYQPRPTSHAHSLHRPARHQQPCGFNNSNDASSCHVSGYA